jgi:thiol-disulfide isomerase/thioredoxin
MIAISAWMFNERKRSMKNNKTWLISNGRGILAILACFLAFGLNAGCARYAIKDSSMIVGKTTWEEWKSQAGWASYSADSFKPSAANIDSISKLAASKKATFVVFGGSWCPDTISQMPMIFKVFDMASIAPDKIELYGVDRKKKEPSEMAEKYGVGRVPTLIILNDGIEKGRIVEYPASSWDENIISILSK